MRKTMEKRYEKMSDMELISLMEQHEEAFNELYARYHKLVYFIAYEMCHNDADAKDVMQETFVKVRTAAKNIREENKFKYWLNAVTVSKCKDLFKKNKYGNLDDENVFVKNTQCEQRWYMLPEKRMHVNNDKELLYHFIECLPQSQKEVLVLKYFSDLSLQEIAEIMDISEGTVKSRLHYAKDSLRGMIETHNGKDRNKPLNFESIDAAIAAAFLYAMRTKTETKKVTKRNYHSNQLFLYVAMSVSIAVLSVSLGLAGYIVSKADGSDKSDHSKQQEIVVQEYEQNTEYRDIYFRLMDFAATRYDMEAKSQTELQRVWDDYTKLKKANNAYYQLLVDQNWTSLYENALKK